MQRLVLAVAAVCALFLAAVLTVPTATAAPGITPPPYVDHVKWAKWGDMNSLRVYPTPGGRDTSGRPGTAPQAEEAWSEVLALAPDAAMPGMKEQFICHWRFAELVEPGKVSWNLEPWRPEVTDDQMVAAGCNPGGSEEPF